MTRALITRPVGLRADPSAAGQGHRVAFGIRLTIAQAGLRRAVVVTLRDVSE